MQNIKMKLHNKKAKIMRQQLVKFKKTQKKSKIFKKVLTLLRVFDILLMHSGKKLIKAKKSAKKSKKVVDKAKQKCYINFTRCKSNAEMIFEN